MSANTAEVPVVAGKGASGFVRALSRFTSPIYTASGIGAMAMLLAIIAATVLQMVFRVFEVQIRGLSDVAAYATAGVTFLGLAYTFRSGGLIRVELWIDRMSPRWRHAVEIYCLAISTVVVATATVASVQMLITSRDLGEAALFLPFPIWMAQVPMAVGLAVLTLAFAEALLQQVTGTREQTRNPSVIADI